ncbi:hypothetical protein ACH3VR_11495 [Microbacterium sp. B2969]|uniref:Uncharacterized protein n=1 Tax=Microbacterium alkaliflavum TaxID=3248839 RepID=A0ABW7Q964_9MICO
MFGRHHKDKHAEDERVFANDDDPAAEEDGLAEWEKIEMQRRLQLEVQSFENGIEG